MNERRRKSGNVVSEENPHTGERPVVDDNTSVADSVKYSNI
jgi:hypothetical protein